MRAETRQDSHRSRLHVLSAVEKAERACVSGLNVWAIVPQRSSFLPSLHTGHSCGGRPPAVEILPKSIAWPSQAFTFNPAPLPCCNVGRSSSHLMPLSVSVRKDSARGTALRASHGGYPVTRLAVLPLLRATTTFLPQDG